MLSVAYARNFYDSDQRPLRAVLNQLEAPTLIVHGEHDILVPAAAAREHHRLVPQSELLLYDANHFMIFRAGDLVALPILEFLGRVESGEAAGRTQASLERLQVAARPFDASEVPSARGINLLLLAVLIALATFLTEDLACIATGLLVAQGRIGFLAGTAACFVGIVVGDVLLYWAGHFLGRSWLRRPPLRWLLTNDKVGAASEWFARRGPAVVFISRFLPGTRVATYFTAGLLHTNFWRFLLYFCLAVAIWTPFLVGAAGLMGNQLFHTFAAFQRWAVPGFLLTLAVAWMLFKLIPLSLTHRGRRLLCGWWCRKRHWEFWPPWVFYPPVVLWIVWLALRYRSVTLFTAANPAIPAGGFIGESKSAILDGLDPRWVARYRRIESRQAPESRLVAVHDFVATQNLSLPVVLKPDVGQRGSGVTIARTWSDVENYCNRARFTFLVQEFVPGPELGVFYMREPGDDSGEIFSITDKRLPSVVGNGHSTLEELILEDRRAVCMAPLYLQQLHPRLHEVPASGTKVSLTDLGTHCRGAIFLDGSSYATPELQTAVDVIGRSYDGFFFGRFDIRAPSEVDFRLGRGLKVLELNGVTSEATHIYDPQNSLLHAYRVLFRQWRLAFEVGRRNRALGTAPASLTHLMRLVLDYRLADRRLDAERAE
jgi:membrane protein DedA with SNARE-associated domain